MCASSACWKGWSVSLWATCECAEVCPWSPWSLTRHFLNSKAQQQGIFSDLCLILMRGCCFRVVLATICQPDLGSCCRFGFLPPHHGGSNSYKVLQDPNGVQVRQPKESCAKKKYVFRSHELAAMIHMYRGHSFSFLFLRHAAISYWCLPTCLLPAVLCNALSKHDEPHTGCCEKGHLFLWAP